MVGYQMEELHVGLVIRWKSSMYGWLSDGRAPCMGWLSDGRAPRRAGYQMEELHLWLVI